MNIGNKYYEKDKGVDEKYLYITYSSLSGKVALFTLIPPPPKNFPTFSLFATKLLGPKNKHMF